MSAQQNLVPNGSFENYKSCSFVSSGNLYQGAIFDSLYNWYIPVGGGSTDYFNTCSPSNWSFAVPSSVAGFQYPKTGNGFIGFAPYANDASNNTLAYVKEYARVKLNNKLKANTKYCLQLYASLSDSSNYKTNVIHGLFTVNDTSIYSENIATTLAQITIKKSYSDIQIGQWQLWEGNFIAQGDEEFLTIGDFRNDSIIDTIFVGNYHYPNYFNYFFIDDIRLFNCFESEINIPNVFTPNQDGVNETWEFDLHEKANCIIYNRWGIKIFETTKQNIKWDGRTVTGTECEDGTYYYVIETETTKYKGFIQLIR